MNIIGLTGAARSGKSTTAELITAQHLVFRHGLWTSIRNTENAIEGRGVELCLADPMKVFLGEVYGWSDWVLWGPSEARGAAAPEFLGLTARHALQQLGTEWGRRMHEDTWIKLLLTRASELALASRTRQLQVSHGTASHVVETCSLFVVSDVRYQNEADAIRAAGGQIWEVVRAGSGLSGEAGKHTSEKGGIEPDVVIDNSGTFGDLRVTLETMVEQFMRRAAPQPSDAPAALSTAAPDMPF